MDASFKHPRQAQDTLSLRSNEHALDPAVVGFFDIVFKPVVAQNVLGHFDHNVVGFGATIRLKS